MKTLWTIFWGASIIIGSLMFLPFPINLIAAGILIYIGYKLEDGLIDLLS